MRILAAILACVALWAETDVAAAQALPNSSPNPVVGTPAPNTPGSTPTGYAWAGAWLSNHYAGGYAGALKALGDEGFLLRVDASGGSYSYNGVAFTQSRVPMYGAGIMIGYRTQIGGGTFNIYVGPSVEIHQNPDPTAAIHGTAFGAKVIADYSQRIAENFQVGFQASYATAFSTYAGSARILYQIADKIWLGPQVSVFGNEAPYNEGSAGALLKIDTGFGEVGVAGGYRAPFSTSGLLFSGPRLLFGGGAGYFATVYLGFPF